MRAHLLSLILLLAADDLVLSYAGGVAAFAHPAGILDFHEIVSTR